MNLVNLIINSILALAAIIAVIISARTFKKERLSRRAFIAPPDNPGHLISRELSSHSLLIKLRNYGSNPANDIHCTILFFNDSGNEKTDKKISVFGMSNEIYCFNPLPHNAEFIIQYDRESFPSVIDYAFVQHLILDISYTDKQLDEKYVDRFIWSVSQEGNLWEAEKRTNDFLRRFTYNLNELKKTLGIPNNS